MKSAFSLFCCLIATVSLNMLKSAATAQSPADSLMLAANRSIGTGDFQTALIQNSAAFKYQVKSKDKTGQATTQYLIGQVYLLMSRQAFYSADTLHLLPLPVKDTLYTQGIDYFNLGLKYFKKHKDTLMAGKCVSGIAELDRLKKESALRYQRYVLRQKTRGTRPDPSDSLKKILEQTRKILEKNEEQAKWKRDSLINLLLITQSNIAAFEKSRWQDSIRMENDKRRLAYQKDSELIALRYEYDRKQALARTEKERERLAFEQKLKEQEIISRYTQKTAETEARFRQKELERRQQARIAQVLQEKKDVRNRWMLNTSLIGLCGFILFSLLVMRQRNRVKKEKINVEREKARSEELLLNILPAEVAEELKTTGGSKARRFENITVLFSDFKSFTQYTEHISAEELVEELHTSFKMFDKIMDKYGIEKIKTIGDSYMAAGGFGHDDKQSVINTVKAALEMQQYIEAEKAARDARGEKSFEMRVGVHTGPVVAGIVGVRKFAYDIWGDTVNTASRMESSGAVGKVNISQSTYNWIKDDFQCEYRGKISAKGKGDIDMYFVLSQLNP